MIQDIFIFTRIPKNLRKKEIFATPNIVQLTNLLSTRDEKKNPQ